MKMSRPLGIQLWTLGEDVGADFEGTLRQVAEIGFQEIELPSFYGRTPTDLAKAISDAGLSCPSFHVPLAASWPGRTTLGELDVVVDGAKALGAKNIVVPIFPFPERLTRPLREGETGIDLIVEIAHAMTISEWQNIADQLNEKAAALAPHGLRLAYHNHNPEFVKLPDGRTAFDLLVAETDPALVDLELDIGWVAAAGLDPLMMIERHASRIRQVHLRDLMPTPVNTAIQLNPADLGRGIMDWEKVLPALERANVEHFYLEQEPPFPGPRIDSARVGFDFLHSALVS